MESALVVIISRVSAPRVDCGDNSAVHQHWDVSCTSIVLCVETIRVSHAEGYGLPGGTIVCNEGYHVNNVDGLGN